jgi:hypothetical protein
MKRIVLCILFSAALAGCDGGNNTGSGASAGSDPGGAAGTSAGGAAGTSAGGAAGTSAGGAAGTSAGGSGGSSMTGGASGSAGSSACGSIATFADGLKPAKEVHVSTSGNDAGDGSAQSPLATIQKAVSLATPGTAVVIHSGTYAGGAFLSDVNGSEGAPIWIGGAAGENRPVLDGGGEAIHISKARYLVVHDLEIRNMDSNGINADDGGEYADESAAQYLLFRGLYIHDIGSGGNQDCLKLSGLNDYFVLDCEMSACGGSGAGSAVDHVGCHRGVLARNHVHDTAGTGFQCKGGSVDIDIRQNRFENGGERAVNLGGSTGFEFFRPPLSSAQPNAEARRINVFANVFVGSISPVAFVGCVDCKVVNNTFIDPTKWLFRVLQETVSDAQYDFEPASKGLYANNILYFDRSKLSGEDVNVGPNTDAGSFTFTNNLWYAHNNPAQSAPATLPAADMASVIGKDPALANPGAGDYSIASGSPAAGQGKQTAGVVSDITGACFMNPPSIGAYELTDPI